jgi:hypothetical protein
VRVTDGLDVLDAVLGREHIEPAVVVEVLA